MLLREKFNPNHEPAGSEHGGEFAPAAGGGPGRFVVPEGGPLAGDPVAIKSEEYDRNFEATRELTPAEETSLRSYANEGYSNINRYLNGYRFGEPGDKPIQSDFFNGEILNLDSAIATERTTSDLVVWRGMRMPNDLSEATGDARLAAGQVLMHKGFTSTSLDRSVAVAMSQLQPTPFLMQIRVPKGSQALHMHADRSPVYGEHEVLLPRGSSLRLINRPVWMSVGNGKRAYVAKAELVRESGE